MSKGPSIPTIKRLFAVSGNICAFPKCTTHLVDTESGKVTGRICHVKARQPGGPRYDPIQTEEERHGFGNLVLMCPIHHDVIDSDVESYTVERLHQIKARHESLHAGGSEPSGNLAKQFLINISSNTISDGSIIFTQNQMGGQAAHSITNVGFQPRRVTSAAANALIAELKRHEPEDCAVESLMGNSESLNLASELAKILTLGGWRIHELTQSIIIPPPHGIVIETPVVKSSLHYLLNWLGRAGLEPTGICNLKRTKTLITVGSQI